MYKGNALTRFLSGKDILMDKSGRVVSTSNFARRYGIVAYNGKGKVLVYVHTVYV